MNIDIITKQDLDEFRIGLLNDIKLLIEGQGSGLKTSKQWLKSSEVRKMLSISPGTLQSFRIRGLLKYSKVGSTFFYKADDVQKMLEGKTTR
jgi:hypothetical protein